MPTPKAIGIDFGGTSVKFGVCSGAEIIADAEPIDTTAYLDQPREKLIDAITDRIAEIRKEHSDITAIGVGIPGLVDFERGHIFEITNVPGWKEVPFRDLLAEKTGLPVTIDNDANCMAFAEWKHGAGKPYDNLLAITLGTGVGGGLIIGNQLHRGAQFCAGELGQCTIDTNRPGKEGVVEKLVGNKQIAQHAAKLYREAGIEKNPEDCTPKTLATAAENNDKIAARTWQDVAHWLSDAISSAIWLLNPQAIIIGGGVARAGDILFEPLESELKNSLSDVLAKNLKLHPAHFGNEAGIIGAAAQAVAN